MTFQTNHPSSGHRSNDRGSADLFEPEQMFGDRYKIIKLLGRGGMGSVYQVEQIFLRQRFALKTLNTASVSEQAWRRFQKEGKAAQALDHRGLVKVHDFGVLDQMIPYMVMDYVDGRTLAELIKASGALPISEVIDIFIQAAEALGFAHKNGIIHRDIKPSNIMVAYSGDGALVVKIVDFGIAKMINSAELESVALTRTGEIFGTPQYMSPEQCSGVALDQRSDIYSLGCAMFEALTGSPPFMGDSVLAIMMRQHNENAPTLTEGSLGKKFPPALETITARMLDKRVDTRYQNLDEVIADLNRVKNSAGAVVVNPVQEQVKQEKRGRFGLIAVLLLLVIIASVAGGFYWGRRTAPITGGSYSPQMAFNYTTKLEEFAPKKYYSAFDATHPEMRIFYFPNPNDPIAYADVKPDTRVFQTDEIDGQHTFQRTQNSNIALNGIVVMEPFHPFELKVDGTHTKSPAYLDWFRPDEVDRISASASAGRIQTPLDDETMLHLKHLTKVTCVELKRTNVTGKSVDVLNGFPDLVMLGLAQTKMTYDDVARITRLPLLGYLDISGSRGGDLKSLLQKLQNSSALNFLFIEDAKVVSDDDVRIIAQIPGLSALALSGNPKITDAGVAALSKCRTLRSLTLEFCSVTPASIETLANMPALLSVTLSSKGWTQADRDRLIAAMKGRKVIFDQSLKHGEDSSVAAREALGAINSVSDLKP